MPRPAVEGQFDHTALQDGLPLEAAGELGEDAGGLARPLDVSHVHVEDRGAQVRLQLCRGPLCDHPAVVDDDKPVGEPIGLFQVLSRQENGRAGIGQLLDHRPQRHPAVWVEPGGRFVQEEDGRAVHQGGGQVEAAAHAS